MSGCERTPRTEMFRSLSLAVAMAALAWSAACGGDGGVTTVPPEPPPNRAPMASGSIPALTLTVGESVTANAASAFSDPDGDQLSYTATSSAAGVASVSLSGSTVTVTGVAAGTATITVTARDPGGLTAAQGISVTVEEGNRAPVVLLATVPPLNYEVGDSLVLDVGPFFSDPDGDSLTFTAETSDSTVVRGRMEGSVALAWAVGPGMATVSVTASDPEGLSATLTATITVTAGNRAPVAIAEAMPPYSGVTGDTLSLDIAPFFEDPDGDSLTFEAESSDAAVATAAVEGSTLTVALVGAGTATVTFTATDPDGLSASITGVIAVEQGNQAPVTTMGPIPPQSGAPGTALPPLDLTSFFADPDGDTLTYAAETSDATVATASVEGSILTVALVGEGTATVTLTATDPGGLSASLEVAVTVTQGNQAPVTTMGPIPPLSGPPGAGPPPLDLTSFFEDPDGDSLTFTAETSDAAVVTASVEGSMLTVALVGVGMATVTVTATDPGGLSASLEVAVTVTQGNHAPVTTMDVIPPQIGAVGEMLPLAGPLDVAPLFTDPDADALTFTAETSDTAVVTVSMEGSMLSLSMVAVGMATVTVTATDPGGLSASLSAMVTVPEGSRPVATQDIQTLVNAFASLLRVGFSVPAIDLNAYFSDPEEEELTYTVESSDPSIVAVSIDGTMLNAELLSAGMAILTATATDPTGLSVSQSVEIEVKP